jgi:hypothetical protein
VLKSCPRSHHGDPENRAGLIDAAIKLVALTMEGKFAGEGLQTIDEDDDMLSAMARKLVKKSGIGESADAI